MGEAMAVRRESYKSAMDKQGLTVGLCMLRQNADSFGHVTESVPALLRTSTVWCFSPTCMRELLAREHLVVMGIPAYPSLVAETGHCCPFEEILEGPNAISSAQTKALAGNSIVVPVIGHLLTFVLAHLRRGSCLSVYDDVGTA